MYTHTHTHTHTHDIWWNIAMNLCRSLSFHGKDKNIFHYTLCASGRERERKTTTLYVTDNFVIITNLNNGLLLLQFYCNDNCGVGSHKHNTLKVSYVWHVITLYMLFTPVQGPNDILIQSETCSQSEQRENKSCVLTHDLAFSYWIYNKEGCVLLSM